LHQRTADKPLEQIDCLGYDLIYIENLLHQQPLAAEY